MGLPNTLQKMLTTLSETNVLRTWSIYPEKDGSVTVKIRFCDGDGAINHDQETHYRRKSTKQVKRDHERSDVWRAKQIDVSKSELQQPGQSRHPHSMDNQDIAIGVVTRSRSAVSNIEILRSDSIGPPPVVSLVSPVTCGLDPDATPFSPSELHVSQIPDMESRSDVTQSVDNYCHTEDEAATPPPNSPGSPPLASLSMYDVECDPEEHLRNTTHNDDTDCSDQRSEQLDRILGLVQRLTGNLQGYEARPDT